MCSGGGTLCTLCRPHLKLMDLWYFASYFKYLAILAMSLDFNFIRQTLLYLGFSCKMKELFKECTDIFTSQTNPLLTSTTSPIYEYFRKRVPYILEGIEISFSARKKNTRILESGVTAHYEIEHVWYEENILRWSLAKSSGFYTGSLDIYQQKLNILIKISHWALLTLNQTSILNFNIIHVT